MKSMDNVIWKLDSMNDGNWTLEMEIIKIVFGKGK